MIVATTERVAGHRSSKDPGPVLRRRRPQPRMAGNIIAGLRSIVGGEIHEYTQLLEQTRRHAVDRLVQNAHRHGRQRHRHDALRFLRLGQTMSEIVAYCTAVVLEAGTDAP